MSAIIQLRLIVSVEVKGDESGYFPQHLGVDQEQKCLKHVAKSSSFINAKYASLEIVTILLLF